MRAPRPSPGGSRWFAGKSATRRRRKIKERYAKKFEKLRAQIDRAEDKVTTQADQLRSAETNRTISMGTTLLGAVFGRKVLSVGTASRAGSAMRSQGKVSREKEDVVRAKEALEARKAQLTALDAELTARLGELQESLESTPAPTIREVEIPPRKSDTEIVRLGVAWRAPSA